MVIAALKPTVMATAKKMATGMKTAVTKKVMREAPVKKSSDMRLERVSDTADKLTASSSTDQAHCFTPLPPPPSGSSLPPPPLSLVNGMALKSGLPAPSPSPLLPSSGSPLPLLPLPPVNGMASRSGSLTASPPPLLPLSGSPLPPLPLPPINGMASRSVSSRIASQPAMPANEPDDAMLADLSLKVKDAASSNSKRSKDDRSGKQATSAKKTKKDMVVELGEPKGRKRRPEHEDGDDVEVTISQKATKKSRLSKPMSKSTSDNPLSEPMPNAAIKTPMVKEPPKLDLPEDAPKWAMNTIKMFKCQNIPERFLQLAETWIKFKTHKKNWEHTGKLSTVDHPKPIADWINCA
ncbi:hypothetical protein ARMGADRAFT_1091557 [Armillaria gallica]|uniref:Uncharacterized protein n=1 Tax=Armillaria gallica TaxID=47427 RepID=A0A2H3CDG8_ARMGA|nr:hypothetical protein ARMGADRAFT_1091557 [Armillaria gallica]